MITFNRLALQNFMSFREASIPLDEPGLILIKGQNNTNSHYVSNGSGKSSIYEALLWCIWGQTVREYKHDKVVNNKIGKDCMVILEFTDSSGDSWLIRRTRNHSDYKNSVALCKGVKWDPKKEWNDEVKVQAKIDALIGLDFKAFTQTFIFHKEGKKQTPFPIMTDLEQKALLEKLYDLEKWSALEKLTKSRISKGDTKKKEVETKVSQLQNALEYLESEKESLEQKQLDHKDGIQLKISNLKIDIKNIEAQESEYNLEDIRDLLSNYESTLETYKSEACEYDTDSLRDKKEDLQEKLSELKYDKKDLTSKVRNAEKEKEVFETELKGECPKCKQEVSAEHCEDHLADLDEIVTTSSKKIDKITKEVTKLEQSIDDISEELEDIRKKERKRQSKIEECQDKVTKYTKEQSKAETEEATKKSRIKDIKERIEDRKDNLSENPYIALLETKCNELKELTASLEEAEKKLVKIEKKIAHLSFLETAFSRSGIPSYLLDDIIPALNNYAQHYSNILTGGTVDIEFSNQTTLKTKEVREKFEVRVTNEAGADSYQGDSSGEKKRIDLCVLFALQKVAMLRSKNNFNLLFMDEIFDSLDTSGVEQAITLLEEELETHPTIFVISHNPELTSFFDNTITVVKDNSFSAIQ